MGGAPSILAAHLVAMYVFGLDHSPSSQLGEDAVWMQDGQVALLDLADVAASMTVSLRESIWDLVQNTHPASPIVVLSS